MLNEFKFLRQNRQNQPKPVEKYFGQELKQKSYFKSLLSLLISQKLLQTCLLISILSMSISVSSIVKCSKRKR